MVQTIKLKSHPIASTSPNPNLFIGGENNL